MNPRVFVSAILILCLTIAAFLWRHSFFPIPPSLRDQPYRPNQADQAPQIVPLSASPTSSREPVHGTLSPPQTLLQGLWGNGFHALGRIETPDGNFEGPMGIHITPRGELFVLDQVNRRIVCAEHGQIQSVVPVPSETAQDFAPLPKGGFAILDRQPDRGIQIIGQDGLRLSHVPIPSWLELGAITGFWADEQGMYLSRDYLQTIQFADAQAEPLPSIKSLSGRPAGSLLLSTWLLEQASHRVTLKVRNRSEGTLVYERQVQFTLPVVQVLLLDADRRKQVVLGVLLGHEDLTPPFALREGTLVVVRFSKEGKELGRYKLPLSFRRHETFRPMTLDSEGRVVVLSATEKGFSVDRYELL